MPGLCLPLWSASVSHALSISATLTLSGLPECFSFSHHRTFGHAIFSVRDVLPSLYHPPPSAEFLLILPAVSSSIPSSPEPLIEIIFLCCFHGTIFPSEHLSQAELFPHYCAFG